MSFNGPHLVTKDEDEEEEEELRQKAPCTAALCDLAI